MKGLRLVRVLAAVAAALIVVAILYHLGASDDVITPPILTPPGDQLAPFISRREPPVKTSDEQKWTSHFQVPNYVHFIWFNTEDSPLQFHHMISVLSAHRIIKPDRIYFHTDRPPVGRYWKQVVNLPRFEVVKRAPPFSVFGERIKAPKYYTSHSNVDRLRILSEYGGIYLDLDVIVTRPFDELRRYVCTIGREQETKACGSVIVCARTSVFLMLWLNSYLDDYRIDEWAYNTGRLPFKLARRYPHLVNMEETRINRPNFFELDRIWGARTFDWRWNYAVHTWYRLWKDRSPDYHGVEPDEHSVKTLNNTYGAMVRTVLYGTADLMPAEIV